MYATANGVKILQEICELIDFHVDTFPLQHVSKYEWYGSGMGVVWEWYGSGMGVVWEWYGNASAIWYRRRLCLLCFIEKKYVMEIKEIYKEIWSLKVISRSKYTSLSISWSDHVLQQLLVFKGFLTYVEDKGTPPSGCLDLSLRFLDVNWIYCCTFFMDGIKILPRNENCEILGRSSLLEVIFGWSRHTTVKTCLHGLPKNSSMMFGWTRSTNGFCIMYTCVLGADIPK